MRDILTTGLELAAIAAIVTSVALSPLPWLAFAVAGAGLLFISRGLSGGGSK